MILFLSLALLILLVAGIWLLRRADQQRGLAGLPQGQVIYADTGAWQRVEQPFFSRRHRLTGKPDYLVEDDSQIVPVEVKSGNAPPEPYPSHVLQLAAYCLLVKETHGTAPTYGVIRYRDQTFAVDYTPALEDWLLDTLDDMQDDSETDDVARSHDNPAQCAACGYRPHCDQRLV